MTETSPWKFYIVAEIFPANWWLLYFISSIFLWVEQLSLLWLFEVWVKQHVHDRTTRRKLTLTKIFLFGMNNRSWNYNILVCYSFKAPNQLFSTFTLWYIRVSNNVQCRCYISSHLSWEWAYELHIYCNRVAYTMCPSSNCVHCSPIVGLLLLLQRKEPFAVASKLEALLHFIIYPLSFSLLNSLKSAINPVSTSCFIFSARLFRTCIIRISITGHLDWILGQLIELFFFFLFLLSESAVKWAILWFSPTQWRFSRHFLGRKVAWWGRLRWCSSLGCP